MDFIKRLSDELHLAPVRVEAAVRLIDEGNTIPFIARYRKEMTGALDDTELRDLSERLSYLRALGKRADEVASLIEAQGALSPELASSIREAETLAALEDLYRPYRPKRRTRASIAKERGLLPLADILWEQFPKTDPKAEAARFTGEEVPDTEAALAGAMDILAERIADDADIRGRLRKQIESSGTVVCEGDASKESVYSGYCDFSEEVRRIAGHRVLAIDRGEREEFLKVHIRVDAEKLCREIDGRVLARRPSKCGELVALAVRDAWARLLFPSLEREVRAGLTERAAKGAIRVFKENLHQLLLTPPLRGQTVMGLDPAYRTGCKIAVVDPTGKVLDTAVVYPTPPQNKKEEARRVLTGLIERHGVTVVSIGNGTASGESEQFIAELIAARPELGLSYAVVSEAGASVYSASKLAAEEFPQFDLTLRSAVSIARRLQDPLAELVKIEPKAIGVGQYQHDMPQKELSESLEGVVEDCVNAVGVDLNTASASLLGYVAGLGKAVAKNIVAYREENGVFRSRTELLKVPKLGKKAFEQCAGFLRIPGSPDVLENTGVHPESYAAARGLLAACGYDEADASGGVDLSEKMKEQGLSRLAEKLGAGEMTLADIAQELKKPGRDMRESLPAPVLRTSVLSIGDLIPGMELTGTVRNIIDFGAFVDIGVHQDGLVHISQMSNRFVRHPLDVVRVGDVVKVWVLAVDESRKRISLTMKKPENPA